MVLMIIVASLILGLALQTGDRVETIRQALRQGDLARAESNLNLALQEEPSSWTLKVLLGQLRSRQGRTPEAESIFKQAIEMAPSEPEPYLRLSRHYRSQGDLAAAEEALERARSVLGDHPAVLYEQSLVAVAARDFVKALALLSRIPSEDAPAAYWETLGRVQASLQNFAAAERAFRQLLQLRPSSIQVLRRLAGFALKQDEVERGWEHIAEARRLAPNSPEVLFEFGQVSMQAGLIGEALASARLLLLLEPDVRDYRLLLVHALMAANEHNLAARHLRQLLEADPQDGESHLLLGAALNRLGNFDQARTHLEQAQQLLENNTEAAYLLGLLAYNQNRDAESESHLSEVIKRQPEHGGAWLALGKLRVRQARWQEAAAALRQSARLLPQDSEVQFQLSRVFRQLGQNQEAQAAVQRYRELKEMEVQSELKAASLPFSSPDPPSRP